MFIDVFHKLVHHLNNKLVFKTIEKKTTKNDQTSKAEYVQHQIWIEKKCSPCKNLLFSFPKSNFTVYCCICRTSDIGLCNLYWHFVGVFIPRPLIKILHAPEPKNPLAGLGLGGDLPNTFQQLATMFMQSAKGRHRIGTLHIFYQSEAWEKKRI